MSTALAMIDNGNTQHTFNGPRRDGSNRPARSNKHALKHGGFASFTTGRLPKGCAYVQRTVNALRRVLEQAVVDRHGDLSTYHAATVQTACRHECRALLWQRWLRERAATMATMELLAVTKEIAAASDARDRCLRSLGIDKGAPSVASLLFGDGATRSRALGHPNGSGAQPTNGDAPVTE